MNSELKSNPGYFSLSAVVLIFKNKGTTILTFPLFFLELQEISIGLILVSNNAVAVSSKIYI